VVHLAGDALILAADSAPRRALPPLAAAATAPGRELRQSRARARGRRPAARPPSPRPPGALPGRPGAPAGRDRAPASGRQPTDGRRHGDPRVRRLGEHGGGRHAAEPDGGGEGGRAGFRAPPAVDGADRRRRVQRRRPRGAGADERPGAGPGRDQPPRPGARHLARQRHPRLAQHPRRGRRPARLALLHQPHARTDGHGGAEASAGRRARRGCAPHRRREQCPPEPAGRGTSCRRPRGARLHDRHWQPGGRAAADRRLHHSDTARRGGTSTDRAAHRWRLFQRRGRGRTARRLRESRLTAGRQAGTDGTDRHPIGGRPSRAAVRRSLLAPLVRPLAV
ncbi:MAG: Aerotolerance protein BatA, partial [uncultured Thermomicrobiales bacterium]